MRSDVSDLVLRPPRRSLPVRFAILVEGRVVPRWQARCIEELINVAGARAAAWIVAPPTWKADPAAEGGALWRRVARHPVMRPADAFQPVDLGDLLGGMARQDCRVSVEPGGAPALRDLDVKRLVDLELDFVLDLALGGVSGRMLSACRSGVWVFRHGEPDGPHGGPMGFREILLGAPVIASALVRKSGDGRADRVLHRGWFRTHPDSLSQSRSTVLLGVAPWPARECRKLVAARARGHDADAAFVPSGNGNGNGRSHEARPETRLLPLQAKTPSNAEVVRFGARLGWNYAVGVWEDLFRHEQWNVGVVESPVEAVLGSRKIEVRWLPTPARGSFIADPFGVESASGIHILAEEFDYESRQGRIASISMHEDGSVARNPTAIELPVHASYPYLFDVDGELYCIPETSAAREVRLFRSRGLPDDWEDLGVIVDGLAAADATVFRAGGRWWLFCVDVDVDPHTHLYAYWASEVRGPWHPHVLNPVKSDPRSSRPAGPPIVYENVLYRPAQDCSRTYGGAVVINRIVELGPEVFREEAVRVIRPDPAGPFPEGVHTLSGMGSVTLVDGKRSVFVPGEFRRAARARLRRLLGGS